jgi:hypothetical protein
MEHRLLGRTGVSVSKLCLGRASASPGFELAAAAGTKRGGAAGSRRAADGCYPKLDLGRYLSCVPSGSGWIACDRGTGIPSGRECEDRARRPRRLHTPASDPCLWDNSERGSRNTQSATRSARVPARPLWDTRCLLLSPRAHRPRSRACPPSSRRPWCPSREADGTPGSGMWVDRGKGLSRGSDDRV